jgi:phage gp46-like protein
MPQIRLTIPEGERVGDLSRAADGRLLVDDGLETLVTISLHTDAPATDDDGLPIEERRGYWADAIEDDVPNKPTGSRLWLVARRTLTDETLREAEDAALAAVAWMVEEGVVGGAECTAARIANSAASMVLSFTRPGETSPYYTYTWEQHFAVE